MNKNKDIKEEKTRHSKEKQKQKKQLSRFAIICASVIFIIILMCLVINIVVQGIKYKEYTDKMYYYKYNELYQNKKATAHQKVTNIDMIKVILGVMNNANDINKLITINPYETETDENKLWYKFAQGVDLANGIEENELKDRAKYINAAILMARTIEWSLDITIDEAELKMSEKALNEFTGAEKKYIAKAVTLGIISNDDSSLEDTSIIKGKLNKLVIEMAYKYATVHYDMYSIDENGNVQIKDAHIVLDEKELPKNHKKYPYVISNINKDVYELNLMVENEELFKEPKEVYETFGYLYSQIDQIIYGYFNTILNVNYKDINEYNFLSELNQNTLYALRIDDVESYVKYVIDNKISLKGSVEPLLPIMYNTGERYVVRCKVILDVLSSNTDTNLLFGDENYNVKYTGKNIEFYIDLPMGMSLNSNTLFVDFGCNALSVIKRVNGNLKLEEKGGNNEK